MSTPLHACPTNLDLASADGRAKAIAATQMPDYRFDERGQIIIKAHNYFVFAAEYENEETGEVELRKVSVLIDGKGNVFRTTGIFAFNAVRAAATIYPPAQWAAGIPFVIKERKSVNRRTVHDVRVLFDAEDAVGPPSEPTK